MISIFTVIINHINLYEQFIGRAYLKIGYYLCKLVCQALI